MGMFQLTVPAEFVPSPMPQIKVTGLNGDVGVPWIINNVSNRWLYPKPDGTFEEYTGIFVNVTALGTLSTISLANATAIDVTGYAGFGRFDLTGSVASITAPDLIISGGIICSAATALTSLSLPNCVSISGVITFSGGGNLTTINLPKLKSVGSASGGVTLTNLPVTTLSLPALETHAGSSGTALFSISGCNSLTSINLPLLKRCVGTWGSISITNCTALTTINMPNLLYGISPSGNITLTGNALSQATVDAILALVAQWDGTNGKISFGTGRTLSLTGGTNATPSAAGLASKAIITARGGNVTHN